VATIIGIPKETLPGEKRVAATPESIKKLLSRGLVVRVEKGAGHAASISDEAFKAAGAELVDDVWGQADTLFKVRPPTVAEVARLKEGAFLVSLAYPERNPGLLDALKARKATALALEKIPRVTRAQKMDVLSSQANLSGYRAVVEAAAHLQGFFGPQVTAAGSTPPAKVLVIGAGVAGLAAVGAARALGAEVRAFDTRAAAREQVESLGAKFLEVTIQESGEGGGGYAKVMSPEFIAAEMALFRAQAKEVDVIITTALVPGTKAPILLPKDVVEHLKPGSLVVDMAAEQGGNCELCKPGEVVDFQGVKILGFTDLPSRMAATSSKFFAMNLVHLAGELGTADTLTINLENDVVRPALVLHQGEVLPPLPPKEPTAIAPKPVTAPKPEAKPKQQDIMTQSGRAWGTTVGGLVLISGLFLLGRFAPSDFLQHSTVFVLACFVGWQVVWAVSPALHTPLMSVTNAISGIIIIGGMLQVGSDLNAATLLGAVAVLFAAINIAGGFLVTQRMLKMFHREAGSSSSSKGGH
jgi:NAD(P) transhydrogenase subunit alpha